LRFIQTLALANLFITYIGKGPIFKDKQKFKKTAGCVLAIEKKEPSFLINFHEISLKK